MQYVFFSIYYHWKYKMTCIQYFKKLFEREESNFSINKKVKASFDNTLDFVEIREVNVSLQRNVYFITVWLYENINYFLWTFLAEKFINRPLPSFFRFLYCMTLCIEITSSYLLSLAPSKLLIWMLVSYSWN